MQQEINRRTRELDATRRKNGPLSEDQEREVADLSQEQGRLADLVAKMVRAMQPAPADDSAVPVDPQGDAPPRPLPEDLDDALQRSLDEAAKKKSSEK